MTAPSTITSPDLEEVVLGAVLLLDRPAMEQLAVEIGLRPDHFSVPKYGRVYSAMRALFDSDDAIDVGTVCDQLALVGDLDRAGGRSAIDGLTAAPLSLGRDQQSVQGGVVSYGRRIRRDAEWRERQRILTVAQQAAEARDEDAYLHAEAKLTATEDAAGLTTWDADMIRHQVWEYVQGNGDDAIPTSSEKLNDLLFGGWRRGDVTFVSGFTSMGKSSWVDGELESIVGLGLNAHLFMNEMALISRALRLTSSTSLVPFGRLLSRRFFSGDEDKIVRAMRGHVPFGMTQASGWSVERICRLIRAKRWDVVAVDSMNLIPHRGIDELDAISSQLCAVAADANCHLIVVGMLNKSRADVILPPPVEGDIRSSGKIAYDAANIIFVHRDQEMVRAGDGRETGEVRKTETGTLTMVKARLGETGQALVRLNRERMRFEDL